MVTKDEKINSITEPLFVLFILLSSLSSAQSKEDGLRLFNQAKGFENRLKPMRTFHKPCGFFNVLDSNREKVDSK